ncbi:MAG: hypothetical protein B1H11_07170 [Desulfobacteraceae bacterium 4484_190.1]|nr:MAG: hypothetical protein B1H11_07170 [Desulfobacteraceae bacterium 4484_190.1]
MFDSKMINCKKREAVHGAFLCMSLRMKRSNLIVPHTAIQTKSTIGLVPALCVGKDPKRALTVTASVTGI